MDLRIADRVVLADSVRTGKPFGLPRLGAPRRLLISRQGRTGARAGSPPDEEEEEARQHAGQSSGDRGLRRRGRRERCAA